MSFPLDFNIKQPALIPFIILFILGFGFILLMPLYEYSFSTAVENIGFEGIILFSLVFSALFGGVVLLISALIMVLLDTGSGGEVIFLQGGVIGLCIIFFKIIIDSYNFKVLENMLPPFQRIMLFLLAIFFLIAIIVLPTRGQKKQKKSAF